MHAYSRFSDDKMEEGKGVVQSELPISICGSMLQKDGERDIGPSFG